MFFNKKKNKKCCSTTVASAGALTAALGMLVLSLLNYVGLYQSATDQMMRWHMFYTPDVQGTILGMLEAAFITYIVISTYLWLHDMLEGKK